MLDSSKRLEYEHRRQEAMQRRAELMAALACESMQLPSPEKVAASKARSVALARLQEARLRVADLERELRAEDDRVQHAMRVHCDGRQNARAPLERELVDLEREIDRIDRALATSKVVVVAE